MSKLKLTPKQVEAFKEKYPHNHEFMMSVITTDDSCAYALDYDHAARETVYQKHHVEAFEKDMDVVSFDELFVALDHDDKNYGKDFSDDDMYVSERIAESICRRIAKPGQDMDRDVLLDFHRTTSTYYLRLGVSRFEAEKESGIEHTAVLNGAL